MTPIEVVTDNRAILDRHTRREARPGMWMLVFPGEFMPDGHDVEWAVKGQVTHKNLNEFCDVVRGTYDERINRQAAAESEPSVTRNLSSEGGDTSPGVTSGAVVPEAPAVPTVEATLEAVLKSQVSSLGDILRDVEDRITGLGTERQTLMAELIKCDAALAAYNGKAIEITVPTPKKRKAKTKVKPKEKSE